MRDFLEKREKLGKLRSETKKCARRLSIQSIWEMAACDGFRGKRKRMYGSETWEALFCTSIFSPPPPPFLVAINLVTKQRRCGEGGKTEAWESPNW